MSLLEENLTLIIFSSRLIDWSCSRYDNAYPYLIHTDERLRDPSARNFDFRSCSGAVIDDVLKKQIPYINGNQQVILLSAGE
jgi:hypothetical protein